MVQLELEFDGHVFVPTQPVHLPTGYRVSVAVQEPANSAAGATSLLDLAAIAEQFPSDPQAPTDRAAQHDHYLYGLPIAT